MINLELNKNEFLALERLLQWCYRNYPLRKGRGEANRLLQILENLSFEQKILFEEEKGDNQEGGKPSDCLQEGL